MAPPTFIILNGPSGEQVVLNVNHIVSITDYGVLTTVDNKEFEVRFYEAISLLEPKEY